MRRSILLSCFSLATLAWLAPAPADLASYNQNFESLNMSSSSALADNGWLVFGNVFTPAGGYLYGYGVFPAPNPGGGFSSIATGEGGANQGSQYINIYSDYNNANEHTNGNLVEANVFQEQTIGAADVGLTYNFRFDHKASSTAGPAGANTSTLAFIKVLDPNAGFATVYFGTFNTTTASTTNWSEGNQLSVTISNAWVGGAQPHRLQFGFQATSTNFNPTGVFYDNLSFSAIPEPGSCGLLLAGLTAVLARRRNRV
jgi:hypothetical protein